MDDEEECKWNEDRKHPPGKINPKSDSGVLRALKTDCGAEDWDARREEVIGEEGGRQRSQKRSQCCD